MMKIAFFGLGNMGGPMAANLLKAGFEVNVFDLFPKAVEQLVALGATTADTPKDIVQDCDVVISMLPAGKHVRELYIGEDGLINYLNVGTLVIDSSTIDSATAQSVAAILANKQINFIDAPVSGGVAGATAGTLSFMTGGSLSSFNQAKPLLEVMGKNIFHAGEVGAGQVAKVCNNMLLSILMVGTSEALQLGVDNGLDPTVLSEIMSKSSGSNWTLDVYNPCPGVMPTSPASNEYQGGFMTDLMLKDLGLAMDTAVGSQSTTPLGALTRNLYSIHQKSGNGKKDFSSIFEQFSSK
ncbi:3-hydroxyisobutyrate dehydrogenase [Psychrosphaera sp. B3R10]|uniref:3-hydroxyisobutyrate dehydrogenase n=1 Tax=unclassified Psychrosphaera TaxID=2641570 RepID=UPI001C0A054B|nr:MULTISPECIES: 3-hydroxyisobutyrate dehydrogenase [unclassified Psychrosphaera]MBU2882826.1 3-hydroxyisobutyrate dehydrogenase [Psychrosphaera sp. I2R16]MBU2988024.1 3-hydroxyisobutyrate dehydrogenase [Psychrosphaera sp. B3R10]MDO6721044.1 3-hydroxyisobutyrate dehydrogenase [Psychrosphaera sp. 1_MG-2023]